MNKLLDGFYREYTGTTTDSCTTGSGYCINCGVWIPEGGYHSCFPTYPTTYVSYPYYPPENKTEKAFKILKLLVKEQVIEEPTTFTEFCNLIEKMAKVI